MPDNLRVISYNCQSFSCKTQFITSLLSDCDILLLQETILTEIDSYKIDQLSNDDFLSACVPAVRNIQSFQGRSSGGLAIYWRKYNNIIVTPIFVTNRIMGIEMQFEDIKYVILNVYCNCDYRTIDSLIEYKSIMSDLSNFCSNESYDEILIMGDFNCDPNKGRFFKEFDYFSRQHSLYMSDIEKLPPETYTYISQNSSAVTSWLDHILSSKADIVNNVHVMYGFSFDDHIPVSMGVVIPVANLDPVTNNNTSNRVYYESILWDKLSGIDIGVFSEKLETIAIDIWDECLSCKVVNCKNIIHMHCLDKLYDCLIECLLLSSSHLSTNNPNRKNRIIVGWNEHCKDLYSVSRNNFLAWHISGRVRSGTLFQSMLSSRSAFKNALKYVRKNEFIIRKQNILSKFKNSNKTEFWKEIKKLKNNTAKTSSCIDNLSNATDIISLFDMKYKTVLDDVNCQGDAAFPGNVIPENFGNDLFFTIGDINDAIDKIKVGIGWDGVSNNHLKYSGPIFRNLICRFFNKLISHNFVPKSMLKGEIRPRVKNNMASKTSSENYRPILNSSNFFKMFEYCLLPILNRYLKLDSCQFAYRQNTSCLSAVVVMKETLISYHEQNSSVHCAMIDLSKAFDKININTLVSKLRSSHLPDVFVNTISYMYRNTFVNTRFNNVAGDEWKIGNGARQGGVLSALLFSFYINDMIGQVKELPVGCGLGYHKTNILCYADDIVLLAPSASGLQQIIDKVTFMLQELNMKINVLKSSYIIFKKDKRLEIKSKVNLLGVNMKRVTECTYLGIVLSEDLSYCNDVDRVINSFLRQFNTLYYKFNYLNLETLSFLFRSYSSSFYGAESWYYNLQRKTFRKISVCYHKAVKRVCGLNVWDSNHAACELVNVPIFKHLHAQRLVSFLFNLTKSNSPCLFMLKYYFRYSSFIYFKTSNLFLESYGVNNIFSNPLCALLSRINFVQNNEQRLSDL